MGLGFGIAAKKANLRLDSRLPTYMTYACLPTYLTPYPIRHKLESSLNPPSPPIRPVPCPPSPWVAILSVSILVFIASPGAICGLDDTSIASPHTPADSQRVSLRGQR